jgi:hypothetical protein
MTKVPVADVKALFAFPARSPEAFDSEKWSVNELLFKFPVTLGG